MSVPWESGAIVSVSVGASSGVGPKTEDRKCNRTSAAFSLQLPSARLDRASLLALNSAEKRIPFAPVAVMRVSLLIPCYVDLYQPQVGMSVVRVLERLGHGVDYPSAFTCCGQPPFNAGCERDAAAVAIDVLRLYENAEAVVVPSGSCATMLRVFYLELFSKQPALLDAAKGLAAKTFEFSEFLRSRLQVGDVGARFAARATFHDGCHGLRELGIKSAPRELLAHVKELELVEMDEAETCCGFGGTFAVKFPQISGAMAEVKSASLSRTIATTLISNDPSCLMHLEGYFRRQHNPVRCLHIAEVLASQ